MNEPGRRRFSLKRILLLLIFGAAIFGLVRLLGPGMAKIETTTLSPMLQRGDTVYLSRRVGDLVPGTVVAARNPLRGTVSPVERLRHLWIARRDEQNSLTEPLQPAVVPRIVVAVAGDSVTWDASRVVVRSGEIVRRHRLAPLHPLLEEPLQQRNVPADHLFLITLEAGRIDSRVAGPIPVEDVRYRISRILWPANRRTLLDGGHFLTE